MQKRSFTERVVYLAIGIFVVFALIVACLTKQQPAEREFAPSPSNETAATASKHRISQQPSTALHTAQPQSAQPAISSVPPPVVVDEELVGLMVANYLSLGTPIDSYWHGGDADERAAYQAALEAATARINQLPSKWVLPEKIAIQLGEEPIVWLQAEGPTAKQWQNLSDVFDYLSNGFGTLPNYLNGLEPHIICGILGNIGAESSFRSLDFVNGHFGAFQFGPELSAAYEIWSEGEMYVDFWHQTAFVWEVLNGWGYERGDITIDYAPTLAKLLVAETVAEATMVFNCGNDGDSSDGVGGFERGGHSQVRVEWAEQIFAQLVEVRP